jgi:hypothetical protein
MTQVPPLGPQADLMVPGQQPVALGSVEVGQPCFGSSNGSRIPLRFHTIDGGVIDVAVYDPAWIGELAYQVRVLRDRARGVFEGSQV